MENLAISSPISDPLKTRNPFIFSKGQPCFMLYFSDVKSVSWITQFLWGGLVVDLSCQRSNRRRRVSWSTQCLSRGRGRGRWRSRWQRRSPTGWRARGCSAPAVVFIFIRVSGLAVNQRKEAFAQNKDEFGPRTNSFSGVGLSRGSAWPLGSMIHHRQGHTVQIWALNSKQGPSDIGKHIENGFRGRRWPGRPATYLGTRKSHFLPFKIGSARRGSGTDGPYQTPHRMN